MQDGTPPDEESPLSVGRRFPGSRVVSRLGAIPTRPQGNCL